MKFNGKPPKRVRSKLSIESKRLAAELGLKDGSIARLIILLTQKLSVLSVSERIKLEAAIKKMRAGKLTMNDLFGSVPIGGERSEDASTVIETILRFNL